MCDTKFSIYLYSVRLESVQVQVVMCPLGFPWWVYLSKCLVCVFSLGVLPTLFHFVSLFMFLSFSLFQCWEFGPVSGMFSQFESQQSSTFRELNAIFYVIEAHVASLRHKKVKVFTDNENASRIVSVGSPKQHLQCLALDIFQLCLVTERYSD